MKSLKYQYMVKILGILVLFFISLLLSTTILAIQMGLGLDIPGPDPLPADLGLDIPGAVF